MLLMHEKDTHTHIHTSTDLLDKYNFDIDLQTLTADTIVPLLAAGSFTLDPAWPQRTLRL